MADPGIGGACEVCGKKLHWKLSELAFCNDCGKLMCYECRGGKLPGADSTVASERPRCTVCWDKFIRAKVEKDVHMAKVLTGSELSQIVDSLINGTEGFDCTDQQLSFLEELATLLGEHCGGKVGTVEYTEDMESYTVAIYADDNLPADGGVWKDYDTDVTWTDGEET